ncbi:phage protein D [Sodalis-like symbiont of Philaenus spumarius]|nr:phage protein D [Sodalis-like symbiont of Philaenus spumarius]
MVALTTQRPQAVPAPTWTLHYGQKDITHDITPDVLGIRFTDQLSGQSDELTVELEDSAGRWRGAWYPGKGDTLSLALGMVGAPLRPCGTFSIDEIELSGPPDTVSLRGLSASVTSALRTRSYRAFEQTSLAAIARRIAQKHHLTLEGQIAPLPLDRVTQQHETDLAFLRRLAEEYGYIVKVTPHTLVFSERIRLREASPVNVITPQAVSHYSLRDTLNRIYQQGKVKYQDSQRKQLVTVGIKADGTIGDVARATAPQKQGRSTSADTLRLHSRARSQEEATAKVCAGLNRHNEYQRVATVVLAGNTAYRAGLTVRLDAFGRLSGVWLMTEVRHALSRQSGYSCELTLGQGPMARTNRKTTRADQSATQQVIGVKADGSVGPLSEKETTIGKKPP